jgi:hypothetical protein
MLENFILNFFCMKDSPDWQNRTRVQLYNCTMYMQDLSYTYIYVVVYTYDGKNVAEYIRLGDGPVNVRDHDLVVCVMPQVDVTPETGPTV